MEVKVSVEGLTKTICGVSDATTVGDIVYALAHATGKRGRFVLVERCRGKSEKTLAPRENLYMLLQQKGEFLHDSDHDIQFVLKITDGAPSSSSISPLPVSSSETPVESPFQRASYNEKNGTRSNNLRKSLTAHGADFAPTIVKPSRASFDANRNSHQLSSSSIKENNFPDDLLSMQCQTKECTTNDLSRTTLSHAQRPVLVPIAARDPRHGLGENQKRSLIPSGGPSENGARKANVNNMGNCLIPTGQKSGKVAKAENEARRKHLIEEIRRQDAQITHAGQVDSPDYDRDLLLWEERNMVIVREVEAMENQIQHLRQSEKRVVAELKELSKVEIMLKAMEQSETSIKTELKELKSKLSAYDADILRLRNQSRILNDELLSERHEQERQHQAAEVDLKKEHEHLVKALKDLIMMQNNQNTRLENIVVNDQRLDSTLLAKQLELDSLQEALKKANLEFLDAPLMQSHPVTPPDSVLTETGQDSNHGAPLIVAGAHPAAAPPMQKTVSMQQPQRILVLKRNISRDPQGMWV